MTELAIGLAVGLVVSFLSQGCGQAAKEVTAVAGAAAGTGSGADRIVSSFLSGGRSIPIERFAPEGQGAHPVVILLHGAYGLERDGEFLRPLGRSLASLGYLVFLPHYFDRTATRAEQLVDGNGVRPEGVRLMDHHLPAWVETVGDAIIYALDQPGADPDRVGLLGFSLGASLASARAANDSRIKAVVDYGVGLPVTDAEKLKITPPTLIFHGDADTLVPLQYSAEFARLLKADGVPCELVTYPGEGHYLGEEAMRDTEDRIVEFFSERLSTK